MNAIAKTDELSGVRKLLKAEAYQKRFQEVLGAKAPQFIASITQAAAQSGLKDCQPESVIAAAMIAATLDLPIDKNLGFSYLVPYKEKQRDDHTGIVREVKVAQFQMGYKGFIQLAIRTSQYRKIGVAAIPEGVFQSWNELTRELELDWSKKKSETIIGYAAFFRLINGYEQYDYWTVEEAMAHAKRYSQSYRTNKEKSLWTTDQDAMGCKTAIKSLLSKWGILSIEMRQAMERDQSVSETFDAEGSYPDNPKLVSSSSIEDLRLRLAQAEAKNGSTETSQEPLESTDSKTEPLTQSEPEKTQPTPQGAPPPRRRNNSPAFNDAKLSIQLVLSNLEEPREIVEEILKDASYDEKEGNFITLDDLEMSVGLLEVYQRAARNLKAKYPVKNSYN